MQLLKTLKTPIIGLSPMDGITDYAFRYMVKKYSNTSLIFTEFVNVDSIFHSKEILIDKLIYENIEKPIIAQFFGKDPTLFKYATIVAIELGFNGIDINMGCPSKNVTESGSGASLIKNPSLANLIIKTVRETINEYNHKSINILPSHIKRKLINTKNVLNIERVNNNDFSLSIKTRIGYLNNEVESWISNIAKNNLDLITIHGRTYKQMYHGEADWEAISNSSNIIKSINDNTLVFGNGDIKSYKDVINKINKYKVDGVLVGRGLLGKPWILNSNDYKPKSNEELFNIIIEHAEKYIEFLHINNSKNILPLRKHLAWYISSIDNASVLRSNLVRIESLEEIKKIFEKYLDKSLYTK